MKKACVNLLDRLSESYQRGFVKRLIDVSAAVVGEPKSVAQAMASPESDNWRVAIIARKRRWRPCRCKPPAYRRAIGSTFYKAASKLRELQAVIEVKAAEVEKESWAATSPCSSGWIAKKKMDID